MAEDTTELTETVSTPQGAHEESTRVAAPAEAEAPKPVRRRRAPRKKVAEEAPQGAPEGDAGTTADAAPGAGAEAAPAPRRRRRATPKAANKDAGAAAQQAPAPEGPHDAEPSATKNQDAVPNPETAQGEHGAAEHAASGRQDAGEGREAEGAPADHAADQPQAGREQEAASPQAEQRQDHQDQGDDEQGNGRRRRRNQRDRNRNRNDRNGQRNEVGNNGNNRQGRRRGHNGNNQNEPVEPSLKMEDLQVMKVAELRSKAAELDVEYVGLRKAELVSAIYQAAALAEGFRPVEGVLEIQNEGYGILRTGNYMQGDNDAFVHQSMIRQFSLRPGDKIAGTMMPGKSSNKFPPLGKIETINGFAPEAAKKRPRFRDLTPIYPNERLVMEHGKDSITGRAIDLVAPIGKGQRGLIVSPPKAGKTTVLKHICQSISANNPEVHLFCLLVDERPEEVTDMERSIKGEVVASTFDMPASNHTAVAELVIEHAKRLVEMGEDVVVVLDSITRLARAYNLAAPTSGRILSGGVDSAALYPPKKFLGAARNIENGGSLTILASALIDTGSKMDEVIFEEFKVTGNMELKLDRDLADRRIFPAIDPVASGTRNEELLLDPQLTPFIWGLRRILANMNNVERSATALVKGLRATNDNQEFLIRSAKKAQQQEYVA